MADIPVKLLFQMAGVADLKQGSAALKDVATAAKGAQGELTKLEKDLHKVRIAQAEYTAVNGQASPRIAEMEQRLLAQRSALNETTTATTATTTATAGMATASLLSAAAIAAVVKTLQEVVQAGVEYESTLTKIEVLTGTSREQTAAWSEELMKLGPEVGKGPQELAEGLYFLASAGIKGQEAMDALTVAAKASSVGMGETKDITQAMVAVMNSYKDSNLTAAQAGDILLATVREGGAEADQLAGAIGRVAGVAATAGIEFEEVGAFIATFTRTIPSSAEAVTSLRAAILNLTAPSAETKEQLQKLGLSADEVRASIREKGLMATLQDLITVTGGNIDQLDKLVPNVRALAGVMNTAGAQGESYRQILESIKNSQGDLDAAFERTKETAEFQWNALKAQVEVIVVQLGTELLPVMRDVVTVAGQVATAVGDMVGWWKSLPEPIREVVGMLNMFKVAAASLDPGKQMREDAKIIEDEAKAANLRIFAIRAANEEGLENIRRMRLEREEKHHKEKTDKEIAAEKKAAQEIAKLREQFSGGQAQKEMDQLAIALKNVEVPLEMWGALTKRVTELRDAGAKVPPVLEQFELRLRNVGQIMGPTNAELGVMADKVGVLTFAAGKMGKDFLNGIPTLGAVMVDFGTKSDKAKDKVEEADKATVDWGARVQDLAGAFTLLGISADSALGQIMGGLAAGANAVQAFGKSVDLIQKGGFANLANGILGGITSVFQGAAAAISIGKAIHGLFTKSPAEKASEEAGRYLGVKLSKEMAETIGKQAKDLGITIRDALLLNLTKVAAEAGKPLESMRSQIHDLMNAVALGAVPAKEGVEELGRAFEQLAEDAAAGSVAAGQTMVEMIQRTRELGIEVPAIAAHVKEALHSAAAGLADLFKGIDFSAWEGGAEDAAYLFASTFNAILAEEGLVAAIEAMGPAWEQLHEVFENFGADAAAILGPIPELMGLMGEETKPIIEGLDAARQVLLGLSDAGYMTQGAFQALEHTAQGAYDQLIANGASEQAALLAIAPMLGDLVNTAARYGIELDADTQALVDHAKAAGVAFPTDPMLQVIDLLKELVTVMGGTLPESVKTSSDSFTDFANHGQEAAAEVQHALNSITMPDFGEPWQGNPNNHGGGFPEPEGAATGAIVSPSPHGTLYNVGEGGQSEVIAPVAAFMSDLRKAIVNDVVERVGGGGGAPVVIVNIDGKEAIGTVVQTMLNGNYLTVPRAAVQ